MWIVTLLCITLGVVCSICPPEWQTHNSNCYLFSKEVLSWDGAQDYCQEFGGYLTEITTREENSFIEQTSKHNYHPNRTAHGKYLYGYWTGGKEDLIHGYWYWGGSGQKFTFTDWSPGEPSNRVENCMHINSNEGFKWNDYTCTRHEYFICEKSQATSGQGVIG
ncbi:perlucin-like protein [Mytilus edulis]|uniref:perlucin-like protein n=1 Tax=Mytilus edulis TaxID=6550 RepID=UPI0039EF4A3A